MRLTKGTLESSTISSDALRKKFNPFTKTPSTPKVRVVYCAHWRKSQSKLTLTYGRIKMDIWALIMLALTMIALIILVVGFIVAVIVAVLGIDINRED
jgi:hypothetical protein